MTECLHCRMAALTAIQRAVLLRIVAEGCTTLGQWGSSCTELTVWEMGFDDATLVHVCDALFAKGLIDDIGQNFLALFRPTVAGVHLALAWLHAFVADHPCEEGCAEGRYA